MNNNQQNNMFEGCTIQQIVVSTQKKNLELLSPIKA
jgi:hypothetical protein